MDEDPAPAWATPMLRWCRRPASAQGDLPHSIDDVVADAEVLGAARCRTGAGFGVGRCRPARVWCPADGAVWRARCCSGGGRRRAGVWSSASVGGRGLAVEPAFEGLVEAFDFALGLGVAGGPFFWRIPEVGQEVFEAVAAAGESGGVDRAVVGERGGGQAVGVDGRR